MVVAHDAGIIYRKACISQMSLDGFRAPIARQPSIEQHLTMWLLLAGHYSGAPEIACILLRKPFQPHPQGPPLQHESYESFVLIHERILLPTGHLLWHSQTSTFLFSKNPFHLVKSLVGIIQFFERLIKWSLLGNR
jgi:hypothetical protein